jgi:hypothetical protein
MAQRFPRFFFLDCYIVGFPSFCLNEWWQDEALIGEGLMLRNNGEKVRSYLGISDPHPSRDTYNK